MESLRKAFSGHWFDRYARFGYAAKGLVWGLVGLLAARVAIGEWDEQADFYGALAEIGNQPLNTVLLVLLAATASGDGSGSRCWPRAASVTLREVPSTWPRGSSPFEQRSSSTRTKHAGLPTHSASWWINPSAVGSWPGSRPVSPPSAFTACCWRSTATSPTKG